MVHSVKVLDREAQIRGFLKVAVQVMQEEKRAASTPSPVEFRESTEEVNQHLISRSLHIVIFLFEIIQIFQSCIFKL